MAVARSINALTLAGMIVVMLYTNWRFTLIALSIAPLLFFVVFSYTRRIKKAAREVRKKEGEIVSVIQEVLTSIRVVKAFGREEYEQRRLEEESLESVEIALRARGLGSVLTTLHLLREREIAELLGIPDDVTQVAMLPVAYTTGGDFRPATRPPVEEITHWDHWST